MPDRLATYLEVPSSIEAGATVSASVVIVNSSGEDVVIPAGSSAGVWQVWLGNDDIPNAPPLPAVGVVLAEPYVVSVGETHWPFELIARRNSYVHADDRDASSGNVAGFPPLPPRMYSARFYGSLMGGLPHPREVPVQVMNP